MSKKIAAIRMSKADLKRLLQALNQDLQDDFGKELDADGLEALYQTAVKDGTVTEEECESAAKRIIASIRVVPCNFPKCPNPSRARGYCVAHHRQLLRSGGDKSALLPLREKPSAPLEPVTIRLSASTASRVRGDVAGARSCLDRWAATKGERR